MSSSKRHPPYAPEVMRPILSANISVNQSLPSVPAVISHGYLPGVTTENMMICPSELLRPILSDSVNQRLPSGPAVIPRGLLPSGRRNSVILPAGVMRPIWLPLDSVNQRLPSGPAAIPQGWVLGVGRGNSVILPVGVMRPIWLPPNSVNQRLPSGPAVIP